ncbi:MAG: winged helix-turn-helix transcriptional regulator [Candidatus Altiarchaeota archaeon]
MAKFTDKEKNVFWGLVAWPTANDNELAQKLGLSRSTVTVIRQRLEEKELISTRKIPDFEKIGAEIFTALYGEYSSAGTLDERVFSSDSSCDYHPNTFYMLSSGGHHVSFAAAADFTEVKSHIEDHHELFHAAGFKSERRHNYVLFPLKLSKIHRFFDYAPLLAEHFGLQGQTNGDESEVSTGGLVELSIREKQVLAAMLEEPGASDGELALATNLSRQTINAMKKRFDEQGLLKTVRIPNVAKLGYELTVFTHMHINPHAPLKKRSKGIEYLMEDASHVLKVSGNLESVLLSVYKNYSDYMAGQQRLRDHYEKKGFLIEDPIVKIFPNADSKTVVDHSFAAMTKRVLDR